MFVSNNKTATVITLAIAALVAVAMMAGGAGATWSTNSAIDETSETTVAFTAGSATLPDTMVTNASVASADDLEAHVMLRGTDVKIQTFSGFATTANADEYSLSGQTINRTEEIPRFESHTSLDVRVYDTAQGAYVDGGSPAPIVYVYDTAEVNSDDTIIYVGDEGSATSTPDTAGSLDISETAEYSFLGLEFGDNQTTSSATFSAPINGTESNVSMELEGATASSMSAAAGDSLSEGSLAPVFVSTDQAGVVLVYADSVPDWANTDDTYAVYDSAENDIDVTLGQDVEDSSQLSGSLTTFDTPGMLDQAEDLGYIGAALNG